MVRIKVLLICMGLLWVLSACRPIQGLDDTNSIIDETSDTTIMEELVDKDVSVEVEEDQEDSVLSVDEVLEEARKPVEDPDKKYVRINTEFLNVREEPSTSTPILTKVHLDQIYEVLGETTDSDGLLWYRLEVPGEIIGFVSSDYCDVSHDRSELEAMKTKE